MDNDQDLFDYHAGMGSELSQSMREDAMSRYAHQDKQMVQSALKDLKNNYKQIEMDIEQTTK